VVQQLNRQPIESQQNNYDLLVQSGRLFQPIMSATLAPLNESAILFLVELGRKIAAFSGDSREPSFLFQRISLGNKQLDSDLLLHNSLKLI